jgi:hypothetical protein
MKERTKVQRKHVKKKNIQSHLQQSRKHRNEETKKYRKE